MEVKDEAATGKAQMFKDFAAAQAEFPVIKKNMTASLGKYSYKYADLGSILAAVRPALNKHGIGLLFEVESANNVVTAQVVLVHASGEVMKGAPVRMAFDGSNKAQACGSAITYARRYAISAFLGISTEDDDDAASTAPVKPTLVSPQVVTAGQAAARLGTTAYKTWLTTLPPDVRSEYRSSPWRVEMWEQAKKADAAKSSNEEDGAEA